MDRRCRAALDDGRQGLALAVVQLAGVPGSLAVDQAFRPAGVEPHHPVPDGLQPDAADLRGFGPRAAIVDLGQRQALVTIVERGPMPAIHGVVRWRLKDVTLWVWEEFQISLSETTLSRELRSLGYRKLSARPRHYAQNPEALELFKKVSPPPWKRSGRASRTALL